MMCERGSSFTLKVSCVLISCFAASSRVEPCCRDNCKALLTELFYFRTTYGKLPALFEAYELEPKIEIEKKTRSI